MKKRYITPCIIGLGYVGLPLFLKLQKKIKTIGYDNSKSRIIDLNSKLDSNNEFKPKDLLLKKKSIFTL
jgi:UDP-N-acetyl-D-galactosamine dehydrogenase